MAHELLVKELDSGIQVLETANVVEYYQYIETTIRSIESNLYVMREAQLKKSVNKSSVNLPILSILVVGVILQALFLFEFMFKLRKKQTLRILCNMKFESYYIPLIGMCAYEMEYRTIIYYRNLLYFMGLANGTSDNRNIAKPTQVVS